MFYNFADMANSNVHGNETELTTVGKRHKTLGVAAIGGHLADDRAVKVAATSSSTT